MSGNVVAWVYSHYPVNTPVDRNRKTILAEVAEAANRDFDEAHPGVAKIATHWGFDQGTVRRHLKALVEDGWLEVTEQGGGRGKATVYRVCEERGAPRAGLADDVNARIPENARIEEPIRAHPDGDTRAISGSHTYSPSVSNTPEDPPTLPVGDRAAVDQVWAAWLASAGRTGTTKLTADRRRSIVRALADYPLADVLDAVVGWKADPWKDRPRQNDVTILLRPGLQIEKFRDLARGAQAGSAASPARTGDPACPRCHGSGEVPRGGFYGPCACVDDRPLVEADGG